MDAIDWFNDIWKTLIIKIVRIYHFCLYQSNFEIYQRKEIKMTSYIFCNCLKIIKLN